MTFGKHDPLMAKKAIQFIQQQRTSDV